MSVVKVFVALLVDICLYQAIPSISETASAFSGDDDLMPFSLGVRGRSLGSVVGMVVGLMLAGALLSACNPAGVPVSEGTFPVSNVVTAMSSNGQFVLVGTQNSDLTTAGIGSLTLINRDVSNSGTLDTAGNTSSRILYGNGATKSTDPFMASINNAALFNPGISPDGTRIAFEAYEPGTDNSTDCTYTIATADAGSTSIFPTKIPDSCAPAPTTPTPTPLPNGSFAPDRSDPVVSNNGVVAYSTSHIGQGLVHVPINMMRIYRVSSGLDSEVSVTDTGAVPYSSSAGYGGQSLIPSISTDGRFVGFESNWELSAAGLSAVGASTGPYQMYVWDSLTASTVDVGADTGASYTANIGGGSISPDGRFVSYVSTNTTGLDPLVKPLGKHSRVYVLDRDVSGASSGGNLTVDQPTNVAVHAESDGTADPAWTHMTSSGRVAWSETLPVTATGSAVPFDQPSSASGLVVSPGAGMATPDLLPLPATHIAKKPGSAPTTSEAPTTTAAAPTSTTVGVTSTSQAAPPSTTQPGQAQATLRPVGLRLMPAVTRPRGAPVLLGARAGSSPMAASVTLPPSGGQNVRINVEQVSTGAVSVTATSGFASSIRGDNFASRFSLSSAGTQLGYSAADSSKTSYAFVRAVVFPWVSLKAATWGFQPYDGYASDPVNVATGSFTNANTDLKAPAGVYGLDWTRTYNSGNPAQSSLGIGWTPSFSSSVSYVTGATTATVSFDNASRSLYTLSGGVFTAPVGQPAGLVHNGDDTWKLTFPSGEHWDYDTNGLLQSRTSAEGQTVTVAYTSGLVSSVAAKNAAGATDGTLTFTYDTNNSLTSVASSDGQSVTYGYGNAGATLASVVDANGQTWLFSTNSLGLVTSETDPSGSVIVTNGYDDNGRVLTQTSNTGAVTNFSYDDTSGTATVTDGATSQVITYVVDPTGRVTSIKDSASKTASRAYTNGYPTTATDRNGVVSGATYYADGQVHTTTDASQSNTSTPGTTTYTYDSANRVSTVVTPNGTQTVYVYTGTRVQPDSVTVKTSGGTQVAQTLYTYDTSGRVTQVTDPDGIVTKNLSFNTAGEPLQVQVGGKTTTYTYYPTGKVHTVVDPLGLETDFTYNGAGQTLTKTGPYASGDTNPVETVYTYDNAGRLATTTGPAFHNDAVKPVTTDTYFPSSGLLKDVAGPIAGEHRSYTYDTDGNLATSTDPDGHVTTNTYGTMSRLASTQDALGLVTAYTYDANGQPLSVASPAGSTSLTHHNALGQLDYTQVKPTSTSDPSPARTTTNTYDSVGRLASVTDPTGAVTTTNSYDALDRPLQVTDARGGVTTLTYTPAGRVLTTTDAAGLVTTNTYDSVTGLLKTVTGPALSTDATPPVTQYLYDDDGRQTQVTSPAGEVTKYTYDALGDVKTRTEPDGVILVNTWDARGDLLSQAREKSTDHSVYSTTSSTYDLEGHTLTATDADNGVTTYTYDLAGNRMNMVDALHHGVTPVKYAEQWTYDADNHVKTTTDGLGRVTTANVSTSTGLLSSVADPSGRTTSYGYDFAGETTSRTFQNGTTADPATTYTFDADGRPLTSTNPSGTDSLTYSAAGDLTLAVAPGGRTTSYTYDTAGRRTAVSYPDGRSLAYTYNSKGWVSSVTPQRVMTDTFTGADASHVDNSKWFSAATLLGNQANLALTSAAPAQILYSFAPQSADNDVKVRYQFTDTTNPQTLRVVGRGVSAGDYEIRITSNSTTATLARVTAAGVVTSLGTVTVPVDTAAHDVRLRVQGTTIEARVWADNATEPTTWSVVAPPDSTYTGTGYVGVADAETGTATTAALIDNYSQYDPTNVPAASSSYTYDADGRPTGEALAGGAARTWGYTNGLLTGYTQSGVGTAINDVAAYDSVGRLQTLTNGSSVQTYGYDTADQLLSATGGAATLGYTYDADGQRTTQTTGSTTLTNTYDDAGELTATTGGTTYTYDAAGRELTETRTGGHTTYAYDDGGRLATATQVNGSTTSTETRSYDPTDQLTGVSDTTGTATTNTVLDWDPTAPVTALLDTVTSNASSSNATVDLAALNAWDTTSRAGATSAVGVDFFGSVNATPGVSGLACAASYDPYGVTATAAPSVPCLGYRGAVTTGGLTYLHARNYNATLGLFTTTDPSTGSNGSTTVANHYTYGNNNPIANSDPTGQNAVNDGAFAPGAFNALCSAHGGRVVGYGSNNACLQHPVSGQEGDSCFPPQDLGGHPIVLHNGSCGSWGTEITGCARGRSIPGANWLCQHRVGVIQALTIVSTVATVVATGGTAAAYLVDVAGAQGVAITSSAVAEGEAVQGAEIMSEEVAQDAGVETSAGPEPADPVCVGNSFVGSTPVVMADGSRKAIEDVKVGDRVLATDPKTGKTVARTVTATMLHLDTDLLDLGVLDASGHLGVLHTTDRHPIWDVTRHRWVSAQDLRPGERLRQADGATATVATLTHVAGSHGMYDLTVEVDHDFYVTYTTNAAGSSGILVHNCDIGAAREQAVAKATGGAVQGEPGGMGMKIVEPGVGSTDVDVIAGNGDFVQVGGPAKAEDLSALGKSLRVLRYAANEAGVGAQAWFEEGTPTSVLDLARRWLGDASVRTFPRP